MIDPETPQLPEMSERWQQTLNWQPSPKQHQQFQAFYDAVVIGNRQFNLTRITEPSEFWEKHLWDSLSGIQSFLGSGAARVAIDIGTGAGFPGVPIAIAQPTWAVTLLDATRKKVNFLQTALSETGIGNTRLLCDRVEAIAQHSLHRETYDVATIRAVAAASVCAEYTLPLLKIGGIALLYRGQWTAEEENALKPALETLGGTLERSDQFETPLTQSVRHVLHLKKMAPTPKAFPRAIGISTQNPL
ncbi:16S rRNA (guanine(527)-N(7))-methyltransferase RsmG [Myxacorys almedinensis]|uniref:Ribosomal RNA small subunit methyltransferase G n=1 Tax=Myxacorys almedinensis A TaxID=2690445 RepID=A0A8J8CGZ8_9CYAN|nr:16S rRNA (guanine(527)-N(7))-methyltransferase RsmG [Myxacorys almedinensis]NDJ16129.1 16S rRNA (guanine(527)-N(7))-methyltransferase RsmG [Myxacorys almedinensis A]